MKRRPVPPTHHLKAAIRKIDKIVWKLHDEQLAAYIPYVLAVSQGQKREIRKLFGAKFTAFGDLSYQDSVVRSYKNLQVPRGLPKTAQVIQDHSNCGFNCGLKNPPSLVSSTASAPGRTPPHGFRIGPYLVTQPKRRN